ncbi:universal stress protein [Pseudonocardia spinosispora]|uniref:universal stress protein n=1 Tax=Pseudonocardia spinosispora TaxID=103441 RepID=UPI00048F6FC2|nr:universal stress protein [Pseudonocardia spinosispora]
MSNVTPNHCSGDGPGVILVAIDGSTTSSRAGAWAAGLARRQGSRLLCVYVANQPAFASMAMGMGGEIPVNFGNDEVAKEILEDVRANAKAYQVSAEFLVRSGDPVTEIERVADEVKVDAVVVGASTQAGHRLIGSVAVRLVRAGRWPVTVVP